MRDLHDANPPEGIPTAYLSAVDLYLEYIAYKQQDMIGFETTNYALRNTQNILLEPEIGRNKHNEILIESSSLHTAYQELKGMSTAEKTAKPTPKEGLQKSERKSINQTSNTSNICSVPPPVSQPLEKTLHTLFGSCFRNMIVGNMPETRKKTTTPANKDTKSLSQLCPSVFSLGYREVSQHVVQGGIFI